MLNERQERLLELLAEEDGWMTSRKLAQLLKVTDRTIRSDVDAVNKQQGRIGIESNVRKGYRAVKRQEEGTASLEVSASGTSRTADIPQTPGARCIYMIQRLLFENRELNLTRLQSQLYVSEYSIHNDIKRIRKMIEPYTGLKLVRNLECISLIGDEHVKRKFYRDLLVAEVQENFLNLNRLAHLYKNFDLIEVKDIFVRVLEEYDYSIHESMFPMLIVHAGTSIERISACHYVQMEEAYPGLEETIEYQIAGEFFDRIAKRLHIQVKEGEVGMFALVIMGRRASNYASDHIKLGERWLNTKRLVDGSLVRIKDVFGVDYRDDEDLMAGLKMHIHSLIERARSQMVLEDIFLDEIKQNYPLVFEMGLCITGYLEEELGIAVADMESGFLALHLGAASERLNSVRKYRAMMIMPYNQTFFDMCEKRIMEMFRERMEVVKRCSYFEEAEVNRTAPDLILTTTPIDHTLNILTVPVSVFVDPETEARILEALNKLDKNRFRLEFASHIGHLVRREHYHNSLTCQTPQEVIRHLCSKLEQEGVVDNKFLDSVLQRERMSPTSFANALAIPHALRAYASRSTIAVARLSQPMRWGGFDVSLVMLFAINESDQRMIKIFFDWVSNIITSPAQLERLTQPCTYEEFVERIME